MRKFARVAKEVNGDKTRYLYEGNNVILELDGSGNEKAHNVHGTSLLSRTADGQTADYFYNGHGDVTLMLGEDGQQLASYYYDAFGNPETVNESVYNPYRYAGYMWDEETGKYYLMARMYDPVTARFLQEDTYRGQSNDPLSLNLYTYCENEPVMFIDPTGHVKKRDNTLSPGAQAEIIALTNAYNASGTTPAEKKDIERKADKIRANDAKNPQSASMATAIQASQAINTALKAINRGGALSASQWSNITKNTAFGGISSSTSLKNSWGSYEYTTSTTFAGQITSVSSYSCGSATVSISSKANPKFWFNKNIFGNKNWTNTPNVGLAESQTSWQLQTFGNIAIDDSSPSNFLKLMQYELNVPITGKYQDEQGSYLARTLSCYKPSNTLSLDNNTFQEIMRFNHQRTPGQRVYNTVMTEASDSMVMALEMAALGISAEGIPTKGTSNSTYKYGMKDMLASEKGGVGGKGFLTPKQMNQFKSMVQEGTDIEFATKDQAMNFIKNKFGDFPEEVAGGRSAQGWHFDSHPINGSADAIEHINLYSKDQGFRVHITWRK